MSHSADVTLSFTFILKEVYIYPFPPDLHSALEARSARPRLTVDPGGPCFPVLSRVWEGAR